MRIAFLAFHFAEYASRLALAMSGRHEVLLMLSGANARDELSDALREMLERSMTVACVELPRMRDPRMFRTIADIAFALSAPMLCTCRSSTRCSPACPC
ncbi:MAG: hypothetical protein ACREQZ_10385 [Woeseiaceae bacterium]